MIEKNTADVSFINTVSGCCAIKLLTAILAGSQSSYVTSFTFLSRYIQVNHRGIIEIRSAS